MKTRNLAVILMSLVVFTNCYAQKDNKKDKKNKKTQTEVVTSPTEDDIPETVDEVPAPTENCLINISLFNESAKNKQYADAVEPWNKAYAECPGANKVIYSRGREILHWEISQVKDDAAYQVAFDKLMGMYDNRIKYFGKDDKYPTSWILGLKGMDYVNFVKNDPLKKKAYAWLEKSVDGMGENCELEVIRLFFITSLEIYKAEPAHAEKYIADYLKVNTILENMASNPDNKNAEVASQVKEGADVLFVQSGAANCETLDGIYRDKIAQNLSNEPFLTNVISFYKRIRCTSSEVYFKAAVAAHKIKPSSESANALAEMSYKNGEHSNAIKYYEEATKLSTEKADKADYFYKMAQISYSELNNYPRARDYARNSLEFNPNNGSAYLLIGIMYAKSKNIYDNPVLGKSVYWAAVDKFVKAKQVDPSIAEEANKLINTYSNYFPTKDDIFFLPQFKAGGSFVVGGWIGESTTCR